MHCVLSFTLTMLADDNSATKSKVRAALMLGAGAALGAGICDATVVKAGHRKIAATALGSCGIGAPLRDRLVRAPIPYIHTARHLCLPRSACKVASHAVHPHWCSHYMTRSQPTAFA